VFHVATSILTDVKKVLGIDVSYTAFDQDVLMHINTVFAILNQLGIGPDDGFMIEDASVTWDDYLAGDLRKNSVKTYIYLRVRLVFDTATTTAHVLTAMQNQIAELEGRLSILREGDSWTSPVPTPDPTLCC
jgi:hypothetical protein